MVLSTPTVIYEKRDQVAYIMLNRPEALNALSQELSAGIRDAIVDFRDDPEMLVAVVSGEGGRAFSSGMDLKERTRLDTEGEQRPASRTRDSSFFIDLEVFKPIIAAIDGYCVAGGLELALQCDIRIATSKSEFGLPEPRWSLLAGYGLHNLSRMVTLGDGPVVEYVLVRTTPVPVRIKVDPPIQPRTVGSVLDVHRQGRTVAEMGDPMLAAVQGGVVILHPGSGSIMGGIGVSGLSAQEDEDLAKIGLKALGL